MTNNMKHTSNHSTSTKRIKDEDKNTASKNSNSHSNNSSSSKDHKSSSTSKDDNEHSSHGKQGFASMDPEKQREIAAEGGRHSHDNDSKHNDKSDKNSKSHNTKNDKNTK